MHGSFGCSTSRLPNRFRFLLVVALFDFSGCTSGERDPAAISTEPPRRKRDEAAPNVQVIGAETPLPKERETADGTERPKGPAQGSPRKFVRLGTVPKLKLVHSAKATAQEADEIQRLIRRLAAIDRPDLGLSGTASGHAFLPVGGMSQSGSGLLTDHGLEASPDLRKLVELGPRSLPFLLDALDDRTPTKLVIKHAFNFGVMEFASGIGGNSANRREQDVLGRDRESTASNDKPMKSYTVTVGDVCLVAIGQIVGRRYAAVWYQPTACIMINSPTHDAKLCRQVRDIWSSEDSAQTLLDSLLLDYATEGVFHGESLDGWSVGADFQVSAAMRLLFYFPAESAELIAGRLDKLDVRATGPGAGSPASPAELDRYTAQCVANGVRADEFVKAVAWCREPRIKAALLRIFDRATDPDVVRASMRSVGPDDPARIIERASAMIARLPDAEGGSFGDGYHLLIAIGNYGGVEAKPLFRRYLDRRSVQRCRSACHALREVRGEWAAELLAPLLDDRREAEGWDYAVNPPENFPRLRIRICDEAAVTIAGASEALSFEMRGTHADLDRQIRVIQATLARP